MTCLLYNCHHGHLNLYFIQVQKKSLLVNFHEYYHNHTSVTWQQTSHLFCKASSDHSVPVWFALTSAMDSQFYNTSYKYYNCTLHAVPNHICPSSLLSVRKIKPKVKSEINFDGTFCVLSQNRSSRLHVLPCIFFFMSTSIPLLIYTQSGRKHNIILWKDGTD